MLRYDLPSSETTRTDQSWVAATCACRRPTIRIASHLALLPAGADNTRASGNPSPPLAPALFGFRHCTLLEYRPPLASRYPFRDENGQLEVSGLPPRLLLPHLCSQLFSSERSPGSMHFDSPRSIRKQPPYQKRCLFLRVLSVLFVLSVPPLC